MHVYSSCVFPGGGPPLNIPPASAGAVTATTVSAVPEGVTSGGLAYSQLRRHSPGSSASARPVSGAFSLDIAKIEGQADRQSGRSALMSRLVNHDNLDDILNGDPVVLPAVSSRAHYGQTTGGGPVRSNSLQSPERLQMIHPGSVGGGGGSPHQQTGPNNLANNAEAKEALDVVLAQVRDMMLTQLLRNGTP